MDTGPCPFCGATLTEETFSRDHIFVDSLGGHQTVPACRRCNSTIGSEVEGRLQRPEAVLNLQRQVRGGGRALPGTVNDGRDRVEVDLARGTIRSRDPVSVSRANDELRWEYRGSPDQVRKLLHQRNDLSEAMVDALMASATAATTDDAVQTTVSLEIDVAVRLVAKVALAAGAYADGAAFVRSDLADELRAILWERAPALRYVDEEALAVIDDQLGEILESYGLGRLESVLPQAGASELALLPLPAASRGVRTAAFVHLGGVNLLGAGLGLTARMPSSGRAGLVVRDAPRRALVRSRDEEIARAIAAANPVTQPFPDSGNPPSTP